MDTHFLGCGGGMLRQKSADIGTRHEGLLRNAPLLEPFDSPRAWELLQHGTEIGTRCGFGCTPWDLLLQGFWATHMLEAEEPPAGEMPRSDNGRTVCVGLPCASSVQSFSLLRLLSWVCRERGVGVSERW